MEKEELDKIIENAENGNKEAQYSLGKCYYYGIGVEKDKEKARILLEKSADQGYNLANSLLGVYYFNLGIQYSEEKNNVEKFNENYEKAMEYFLKNRTPLNNYVENILKCKDRLVEIYKEENKDIENLYEQLYEFCNYTILLKLGEDYELGNNVGKDLNKAIKFYLKANKTEASEQLYSKIIDLCNKYGNDIEDSAKIIKECTDKIKNKDNSSIENDLKKKIDEIFG